MFSTLETQPDIYAYPQPKFARPTIIGYIALENLKFAREVENKKVCYNLNLHIDKAKCKEQAIDVKLTELLKFLLHNEKHLTIRPESKLESAKFICYRGLLTCVACTPYEKQEPWKIVAILFKGHIYLCARKTEEKLRQIQNMTERDRRCTSWGYKFEQFVLSDDPLTDPNPDRPVDEEEEFSLVFNTTIKRHEILYGAEMDGVRCDKGSVESPPESNDREEVIKYLQSKEFIELKTNRHITNGRQDKYFRFFKTKKWWCQSFFVGIDNILCGFRNDDGIVEELKVYSLSEIKHMSRRFWDPNVCLNFLENFLTYVKRCLSKEIRRKHGDKALLDIRKLPLLGLMFECSPGCQVRVAEYCHDDDPILMDWFVNSFGRANEVE
ncbi:decapping and exoribonuclease protein isoform X2 [Aricia agestis]|uniref:decapping and exoribonuclease protein isoform X2 n=1 Tax=Aricia agestis TaxID=91739 RepID=UPI001C205943|nr:decapping and exoribonuclease protein isoform X2 [Aricia agestis]